MSEESDEAYGRYLHNQARGEDDRPREQEEEEYQEDADRQAERIEEEKMEAALDRTKWKPKLTLLDDEEVQRLWWSGEGMMKNPTRKNL